MKNKKLKDTLKLVLWVIALPLAVVPLGVYLWVYIVKEFAKELKK